MKQELGPNQREFIAALRGGEFSQCRDRLSSRVDGSEERNCCLGVACRISGATREIVGGTIYFYGEVTSPPVEVVNWLGLRDQAGSFVGDPRLGSLMRCNDTFGMTFEQIADFCEANPEKVFTEPR